MPRTLLGIDQALREGLALPGRGRVGLVCNGTTVTSGWVPTAEALQQAPGLRLERIFSPQHGFAAEKQDNMIASADGVHPTLGVPIISLYSERREPAPEALDGLDALLIDLQDVGTRVYTFLVTAVLVLRAAAARHLPAILLDRPNPIGGVIEGPVLEDTYRSFVGIVDVPLRHGLTPAEFCRYACARLDLTHAGDDWLTVVPLKHWARSRYHDESGLPWAMPSPNMPTLETAIVYPGQVMLEGTHLSEGRGTARPFEIFGAPYLDPCRVRQALREDRALSDGSGPSGAPLAGALLREVAFEPTSNKHAGQLCRGFQVHVIDRRTFHPVAATVAILCAIRRVHPDAFAWREPPYEYEWERRPIDLISGTDRIRAAIDAGAPAREIVEGWKGDLAAFRERVRPFLIYPDADHGTV